MIVGIGIDIVDLKRVKRLWNRYGMRFVEKILTSEEMLFFSLKDPIEFLASRFAAKEAGVKALGTGFTKGITLKSIWIDIDSDTGRPKLIFEEKALEYAKKLNVKNVHLSLTHTKEIAAAVVILEA